MSNQREIALAQLDPAQVVGHIDHTFWFHKSGNTCPRTGRTFGSVKELVLFIEREFGIAEYNSWLITKEGEQAIAALKVQKAEEAKREKLEQTRRQKEEQRRELLANSLPVRAAHGYPLLLDLTKQTAAGGDTHFYQVAGGPGIRITKNDRWKEAFYDDMRLFLERQPEGVAIQFLKDFLYLKVDDKDEDSLPLVINATNYKKIIGLHTQTDYGYYLEPTEHRVRIKNYGTAWVLVPIPS